MAPTFPGFMAARKRGRQPWLRRLVCPGFQRTFRRWPTTPTDPGAKGASRPKMHSAGALGSLRLVCNGASMLQDLSDPATAAFRKPSFWAELGRRIGDNFNNGISRERSRLLKRLRVCVAGREINALPPAQPNLDLQEPHAKSPPELRESPHAAARNGHARGRAFEKDVPEMRDE